MARIIPVENFGWRNFFNQEFLSPDFFFLSRIGVQNVFFFKNFVNSEFFLCRNLRQKAEKGRKKGRQKQKSEPRNFFFCRKIWAQEFILSRILDPEFFFVTNFEPRFLAWQDYRAQNWFFIQNFSFPGF